MHIISSLVFYESSINQKTTRNIWILASFSEQYVRTILYFGILICCDVVSGATYARREAHTHKKCMLNSNISVAMTEYLIMYVTLPNNQMRMSQLRKQTILLGSFLFVWPFISTRDWNNVQWYATNPIFFKRNSGRDLIVDLYRVYIYCGGWSSV